MTLYLVSTPIGNLNDISLRALEVLKEADLILAEDTRKSGLLLKHFGIERPMESFFEHNEISKIPHIIDLLRLNKKIALISDAGTPAIADPGFKLIREAAASGCKVEPIPGASAVLAALVSSGLPTDRFLFAGYLPKSTGKAGRLLESLKTVNKSFPTTFVFLESPHRLQKTLNLLAETFPNASLAIAKELTKIHEEVFRGKTDELARSFSNRKPKGEYTLVLNEQVASSHD